MARRVKSSRRKMTRKMSKSKSKKTMKRRGLSSRAKKISEILSSTIELAPPKKAAKKTKKAKKAKKATKKKTKKGMTYKSFVKANFKKKQQEMPGSPAPEIIKAVAAEWRKVKTDGEAEPAKKKKKTKTKTDNRPAFRP